MVIFLVFIVAILLLIVIWTVRAGISPMPTLPKVKKSLLANLPDDIVGTVFELGSGWGTLAGPLAKRYPDCRVMAYEISPVPYFVARLVSKLINHDTNLSYHCQDFFQANLTDAALIICYLYPAAMERLKDKFEKELKKGTLVVTHSFAIPGWRAKRTIEVDDLYKTKIYFYVVG
jgi:cyclopropane fatty-acyl-phospholipid synthase-like methyltransferase